MGHEIFFCHYVTLSLLLYNRLQLGPLYTTRKGVFYLEKERYSKNDLFKGRRFGMFDMKLIGIDEYILLWHNVYGIFKCSYVILHSYFHIEHVKIITLILKIY